MAKRKPKKRTKQPKRDFAQNALAVVLKATGSKSLVEDKVEHVDFKREQTRK